mgnify:CR=1 FL=1
MAKKVEKEEPKKEPTPKLTEGEITDFFKSFLSDTPFESDDVLLGGALTIRFRALTSNQSLNVYNLLKEEQTAGVLTNDINYMTRVTVYRLVQSLVSINDVPFLPDTNVSDKAKTVLEWPNFKLSAFCDAFKNFEDKLLELTKEVTNENFWKAAAQSS